MARKKEYEDIELIITFRDLSLPLKILVVFNWVWIGLFGFWFIVGLVAGLLTGY